MIGNNEIINGFVSCVFTARLVFAHTVSQKVHNECVIFLENVTSMTQDTEIVIKRYERTAGRTDERTNERTNEG
jgi:general stress protein CsbA